MIGIEESSGRIGWSDVPNDVGKEIGSKRELRDTDIDNGIDWVGA